MKTLNRNIITFYGLGARYPISNYRLIHASSILNMANLGNNNNTIINNTNNNNTEGVTPVDSEVLLKDLEKIRAESEGMTVS